FTVTGRTLFVDFGHRSRLALGTSTGSAAATFAVPALSTATLTAQATSVGSNGAAAVLYSTHLPLTQTSAALAVSSAPVPSINEPSIGVFDFNQGPVGRGLYRASLWYQGPLPGDLPQLVCVVVTVDTSFALDSCVGRARNPNQWAYQTYGPYDSI